MVKEDDLEAGRPEFQPETVLKSGLALLFLQDSKILRRFMASTLSFFKTRGSLLTSEVIDIGDSWMVSPEDVARFLGRFLADFGEAGGDTLL